MIGKRVVSLHLQQETIDTMSIIVQGQIWAFCARFDENGITGGYVGEVNSVSTTASSRGLVVSNAEEKDRVMAILGDAVFKNLMMRVVVSSALEEGSDVAQFVSELRSVQTLHFA